MKKLILTVLLVLSTCADVPAFATEPSTTSWLLGFFSMHATPAPRCAGALCTATEQAERDDFVTTRLSTAQAIVTVAYDTSEPSLFPKSKKGRAKTALLLASIAAHETGLRPRLVRGKCLSGECDGGKAVGLMQIHPGDYGFKLTPLGLLYCAKGEEGCYAQADLLADPVLTQRTALHILRGGLSRYTGEGATEGDTSDTIREWANTWLEKHPAPLDEAVMTVLTDDAR